VKSTRLNFIIYSAVIPFLNLQAETASIYEAHPLSSAFYPASPISNPSAENEEAELDLSEEFLAELQIFDEKEANSEELIDSEKLFIPGKISKLEEEPSLESMIESEEANLPFAASQQDFNNPKEELIDQNKLDTPVLLEKEIVDLEHSTQPNLTLLSKEDKAVTFSSKDESVKETMNLELITDQEIIRPTLDPELEKNTSFVRSSEESIPEVDFLPEPATDLISSVSLPIEKTPEMENPSLSLVESNVAAELNAFENPENPVQLLSKNAIDSIENTISLATSQTAFEMPRRELKTTAEDQEPPAFASLKQLEPKLTIDLRQVFSGSPLIYSALFILSLASFGIWFYSLFSLKRSTSLSSEFIKNLRAKLVSNQYEDALTLCMHHDSFFSRMLASGISSRKYGAQVMLDAMKSEGKRATVSFWQKIALLNDIAIIAPMLGLLGTVLGMFYAFYDLNRSLDSVSALFDGLGISVGTTVAGLFVAILSMVFHSLARFRLVRALTYVENEANNFASLIDSKVSVFEDRGGGI